MCMLHINAVVGRRCITKRKKKLHIHTQKQLTSLEIQLGICVVPGNCACASCTLVSVHCMVHVCGHYLEAYLACPTFSPNDPFLRYYRYCYKIKTN